MPKQIEEKMVQLFPLTSNLEFIDLFSAIWINLPVTSCVYLPRIELDPVQLCFL